MDIWKIIFLIIWLGMLASQKYLTKFYDKTNKILLKKNKYESTFILFWQIAFYLLPIIYISTSIFDSYNINLPAWARIIGVILFLASWIILHWSRIVLDKNWSPMLEINKDHNLITIGPYKRIRHPIYLSVWLRAIGQFLLLSNWIIGIVGIVIWAIIYFVRIESEEKMMIEQFSDKYKEYMKKTGKILPKLLRN